MPTKVNKPVTLVIMDGWGNAPDGPNNAVYMAKTPVLDSLCKEYPTTSIAAHGKSVGLPSGQMGNSEVGHLNLGAGRVVKQDLVRIGDEIKDGSFQSNPVFLDAIEKIKAGSGRAHVLGLYSPGGVHSSLRHLYGLVDLLSSHNIEVFLHAITDGRDTPPRSARKYLKEIEEKTAGKARISVVVGRFYSMDRDKRWDRVKKGYMAHLHGIGQRHKSADEAVGAAYEASENDEFIKPRIIVDNNETPIGLIEDNDGVFFYNFRADRAREITQAIALDDFDGFDRGQKRSLSSYVCMTRYSADFDLPVAYPPHSLSNILGEVVCNKGLRQFRCAETEKYAHVTFFLNGGREKPFENEDRKLIPSPTEVETYDKKPQMSAAAVCDAVVEAIEAKQYDLVLVNFANGDMVGHTGFLDAAIVAAQTVDTQIGRIVEGASRTDSTVFITADHGNLEKMVDEETGEPHTAHTNYPVPFIYVDPGNKYATLRDGGALCDVAPTILKVLGIDIPEEMTGLSLVE
jgi:2,3-bisphosphoglycerate-independent phosphoglycerate mutase